MHILYIHQYFKTPEEIGCVRSYHIAKAMVQKGHRVTLITAHNEKKIVKQIEGFEVRYLPVSYDNSYPAWRRIWAFLKFARLAKRESSKILKPDLAYVVTTPLTTGLIALHLKRKLKIPYLFEVGDLWPEAPIQMGVIKNSWFKKRLYAFEQTCYQEAKGIVALSPPIAAHITKLVPSQLVSIVTNFANTQLFSASNLSQEIIHLGYIGTFGRANKLSVLIDLAKNTQLKGLSVHFHLMGEGAELPLLKDESKGLGNLTFHPAGSQADVKNLMDSLHAVFVLFDSEVKILNTGSPNKFFDGLAAGKVIMLNISGWINELVMTSGCGFHFSNYKEFEENALHLLVDKKAIEALQQNARILATQFDIQAQTDRLLEFIES